MKARRLICIITALVMALSVLPATVLADGDDIYSPINQPTEPGDIIVNTGDDGEPANVVVEIGDPNKPKPEELGDGEEEEPEPVYIATVYDPSNPDIQVFINNPNINIVVTNEFLMGDWWGDAWAGTGTKSDPFLIEDAGNLMRLTYSVQQGNRYGGCYFKLTADVDIAEYCGESIYTWKPIGSINHPFYGTFDGDGHTVSGLKITGNDSYVGLFGENRGTILNLNVVGEVSGKSFVGGVCGSNLWIMSNCTFRSSETETTVEPEAGSGNTEPQTVTVYGPVKGTGEYIGGVAGYNQGFLIGCTNYGVVETYSKKVGKEEKHSEQVGGVCGRNQNGYLTGCVNKGSVGSSVDRGNAVGGVCGLISGGTFRNNQNYGEVYGRANVGGVVGQAQSFASYLLNFGHVYGRYYVGGIAGDARKSLSDCDNYGSVDGNDCVGGITGWLSFSTVSSCDNMGSVYGFDRTAQDIGGIVGYNRSGIIENCCNGGGLWYERFSEDVGGIAGSNIFGTVSHCINTAQVNGSNRVGGIVGDQNEGTVEYCANSGHIRAPWDVGGITGFLGYGTVQKCYNSADIEINRIGYVSPNSLGGIIGTAVFNATIQDCVNTGNLYRNTHQYDDHEGDDVIKFVGGIAGKVYECNLYRNLNIGTVDSDYKIGCIIGELYGEYEETHLEHNYYYRYDSEITGIGRWDEGDYSADQIKGLSEHDYIGSQTSTAYVGWDFNTVWHTSPNGPRLNSLGITTTTGEVVIEDLNDVRHLIMRVASGDTYAGCTVRLEADLDLSGLACIGTVDGNPATSFAGIFDGNGHTITKNSSRYDQDDENLSHDGVFGTVTGTVRNLKVVGSVRGGTDGAGGIVKILDGGRLENCSFVGNVKGYTGVGGLVGGLEGTGQIRNCVFSGGVYGTGGEDVGGLVGVIYGGTVERCLMNGTVVACGQKIGGFAGEMISGSLHNCVHIGAVDGLIEDGHGDVVQVGYKVGGLVGSYRAGTLADCFHLGTVCGFTNVGGVLGEDNTQPGDTLSGILHCYYQSGALTYTYGMNIEHDDLGIGRDPDSTGVYDANPSGRITPVSAPDFKLQQSFSGWDFENDWVMTADCPAISNLGVTVSFRPNGGSGTMPLVVLPPYGDQLPKNTFTREGYTFIGWNTSTDASGAGFADEETVEGTSTLLLYAIWAVTDDVEYIDKAGAEQTAAECFVMRNDIVTLLSGWYVVDGTVTIQKRMEIKGDVHIILKDGALLDAQLGIHVPEGSRLSVYGQSGSYYVPETSVVTKGTGRLNANNLTEIYGTAHSDHAAIGGNTGEKAGDIVLCGGVIDASAVNGAAIGGAFRQAGGTLSVFNACVYARGGNGSAGIGAGAFGEGGALELNGGYTWAAGSTRTYADGTVCASPGIGTGVPEQLKEEKRLVNDVSVSINNAYLHAEAGKVTGENDIPARAIGADMNSNYNLFLIYPLIHVQAKDKNGAPVDWKLIPSYCNKESVDITPCTVHRGCDDALDQCRWCGSSTEAGIRFVTFDYNLGNYADPPKNFSYGVEPGGSMRVTANLIIPTGLSFLGWNTKADGTGNKCVTGDTITPTGNLTLYAQWAETSETSYIDRGMAKSVEAFKLSSDMRYLPAGWYVAEGELTFSWMLHVEGDVKIILKDGCIMNASRGIIVPKGSHLSIYGQSSEYTVPGETGIKTQGTGVLNATRYQNSAAIGGHDGEDSGSIDIYGGMINATGYTGAAIGGGNGASKSGSGNSGAISIYDGYVNAYSEYGAAAIGGGLHGSASTIVISGGYVTAEAGIYYNKCAPAIGSGVPGDTPVSGGRIMLLGGTVTAKTANPPSGFEGAQAIGVNLDNPAGTSLFLSSGANFRAYDDEDAVTPVDSEDIQTTCTGRYVRLERCEAHYGSGSTCRYCGADFSNELDLAGSGDEQNPYRLGSQTDWNKLATYIAQGGVTAGKYFMQTVGFTVTTSIGSDINPFKGTFYASDDYTLTYNANGGAPFAYIEDATIRNVRVSGTINAGEPYAAGFASHAAGTCLIENCCSSVTINSGVDGEGYHGGLIAQCASGSNVTVTGCLFNGQLNGTETTDCGGFIGRAENCTVTISNSMMAAGAFEPSDSQNFVNGSASPTLTSCYYRTVTADDASQGTRAYVVSGDILRLSRVSGGGFGWDSLLVSEFSGKLFGAAGDQIVFTSSLGEEPLYCADAPLTRNGSRFTITLPAQDTTIKDAQKVWFSITRATGLAGGTVITNYYDGTWPGNVVTVSAIPNKAYVFSSVTVTDSYGNELTLTPNEDGDFTFIMPGDAVNVTASFLKKYEYNTTTRELRLLRGTFSDDRDDRWISNDFPKDLVLSVTAEQGVRFTGDCSQLFYGFFECTSFDLSNVDTAGLTSAAQMFLECEDLTTLNLTGWDVSALTDISQMFQGCTSLTSVSFNGWQDAPISDAGDMLKGCTALSSADLSGLQLIGAVTDGMFDGAGALSEVRVPGGLHITEEMQLNNNGLGWVEAGTDILLCHGDEYGTLKGYGDEGTVYRWATVELGPRYTLENGILSLNWGDFNKDSKWGNDVDGNKAGITAVTAKDGVSFTGDCTGLFSGFSNCVRMDLNKADTTKMTNMSSMFANCSKLSTLNVSDWITVNVTDMSNAFLYCEGLDLPDLSGWNTSNVTNMFGMFSYCSGLTGLDISGWNTAKVNSMGDMFLACTSLEQLDLSRWNTSAVTDMERMFYLCSSLKSLDLSGFDTRAIDTPVEGIYPPQSAVSGMFTGAAALRQLKVSPNMAVTAEMQLNTGNPVSAGWVVSGDQTNTVVSGEGAYAVIAAPSEITTFVWAAEPVPEFEKQSAGLKGQIEVNFFMDLDCLTAAQRTASYTDFTVSGKNGRTERVGFDPGNMNTSGEYYGFTFPVNSVQMADKITAVFHYADDDGNDSTVTKEYSVEEYLGYFIDQATQNPGTYSNELIDLVKAINDYGYYAQQYLSANAVTPWTIGTDHTGMSNVYTASYTYTKAALEGYRIQRDLNADIKAVSYSLTLDTDTAINLFITTADGYTGSVTASIGGNALDVIQTGGRYKIVIAGIPANLLGDMKTVTITTTSGTSTVRVSALSYAYAAFDDSDEARMAMSAMYDYYLKSNAYIQSLNN